MSLLADNNLYQVMREIDWLPQLCEAFLVSNERTVVSYEGSYAPKSYFKFCFEDPVYFIHVMEQNLGNQNRNWSNRIEIKATEIGAKEQKLKQQKLKRQNGI